MISRRVGAFLIPLAGLAALAATPAAASAETHSLLFVQETSGGEVIRIGPSRYKVRLDGVSSQVTTFADRPARQAGQESARAFVARWGRRGFASDPPNAALVVHGAPASSDVMILTLSHPRYDRARRTLTYAARPLDDAPAGELAGLSERGDRMRARRFGAASLFIDDSGWTVAHRVVLNFKNVLPGHFAEVQLDSGGDVAFATSTPSAPGAGLQFNAASVRINAFQVSPQTVAVALGAAPDGTLNPVDFSVSLFIVGDADAEFGLHSYDAGFQPHMWVTASIGGAPPQVIPQG
jgi:hypothetical protein